MILLAVGSLMNGNQASLINPFDFMNADKILHLVAYGILGAWLGFILRVELNKKWCFLALMVAFLFGTLMEILQFSLFTGRYFEIGDIIANIIGSVIGVLLLRFIK